MFFNDHPEFLETSHTAASRSRLNMRHLGIIEENSEILSGSSVVDIASHDGRWAFAALQAGASHVTGIEGRQALVKQSRRTFESKGVDPECYRFIRGDVHAKLRKSGVRADVVMCLGFLYHTARYPELFKGIRRTKAEYVIIDSRVLPHEERPVVEVRGERTGGQALAVRDRFAMGERVLSAVPSEAALEVMLDVAGYEIDHRTDWGKLLEQHPNAKKIAQYRDGTRVTFRARRRRRGKAARAQLLETPGT